MRIKTKPSSHSIFTLLLLASSLTVLPGARGGCGGNSEPSICRGDSDCGTGSACNIATGACTEIVCGDGLVQGAEVCDDGSALSGDGCSSTCTVEAGYTCDTAGRPCVDIDECSDGTATCDANATCTNTLGSFSCSCVAGYLGDGVTCADIDECTDGTSTCGSNATCANTPGLFTCTCDAGYEGDGVTCEEFCGNGGLTPSEQCDDGGTVAGDGCDATCNVEHTDWSEYELMDGSDIWSVAVNAYNEVFVTGRYDGERFTEKVVGGNRVWRTNDHGGDKFSVTTDGVYAYVMGWGGPVQKLKDSNTPRATSGNNDGDGYYIRAGADALYFVTNSGVRAMSFDLTTVLWTHSADANGDGQADNTIQSDVVVGEDGFVYFVGVDWATRQNLYVIKLNPEDGTKVWGYTTAASSNAQDARLAVLSNGIVYVTMAQAATHKIDANGVALDTGLPYVSRMTQSGESLFGYESGTGYFGELDLSDLSVMQRYDACRREAVATDSHLYCFDDEVLKRIERIQVP